MNKQIVGKVNARFEKNSLLNIGQGKSLLVPNSKLLDAPAGSIVEFEGDPMEVSFIDKRTGEVKAGKYLESPSFKLITVREPVIEKVYGSAEQAATETEVPFE